MKRLLYITILFTLSVCSCSIKEDSRECPCYVYFSVPDHYDGSRSISFRIYGSGLEESGELDCEQIRSRSHRDIMVPKGMKAATCLSGYSSQRLGRDSYLIPLGQECEMVFAHRSLLKADGDEAVIPMIDDKQFCVMTVLFESDEDPFPYSALLECNSCGISLEDCSACEGAFRSCGTRVNDSGSEVVFIIPRQKSEGEVILLHLYEQGSETPICTLNLGSDIRSSGYDWTKQSLDDIQVKIDNAVKVISITVQEWKNDMKEEVII